jgi:hypothetical protein
MHNYRCILPRLTIVERGKHEFRSHRPGLRTGCIQHGNGKRRGSGRRVPLYLCHAAEWGTCRCRPHLHAGDRCSRCTEADCQCSCSKHLACVQDDAGFSLRSLSWLENVRSQVVRLNPSHLRNRFHPLGWNLAPLSDGPRRNPQSDSQFRQTAPFGLNPICELFHNPYVAPLKL